MKKYILSLLLIIPIVFSNIAKAENLENIRLNSTIITTEGFETTIKDETKNINVITKESIQDFGYADTYNLLRDVPFLNVQTSVLSTSPIIDIRGYGNNAAANVKIMVDEVSINIMETSHSSAPTNALPISQISQIEIIPGGGAVLYGNNATGGVINFVTDGRNKDNKVSFQGLTKSFNDNSINFSLGYKLIDSLYIDLSASTQNKKGYRKEDKIKSNTFYGKIYYDLTDKQSIFLNASAYNDNGTSSGAITKAQLEADRRAAGNIQDYTTKKQDYGLQYNLKPDDNNHIKVNTYYQNIKNTTETYGLRAMQGTFKESKTGINIKEQNIHGDGKLVVGYEFLTDELKRNSLVPAMRMNITNKLRKDTHSIFALEKYKVLEPLEISAGYRFEKAKYKIERKDGSNYINADKNGSNNAYSVASKFIINETDNIYASYERGYVSPNPTQLTDKVNGIYVLNNLKSQTTDNYEIGYKGIVMDSYIMATVFHAKNNNEIFQNVTMPTGPGHGVGWVFYNINETKRTGAEFFAEHYLGNITISESISYINAKITKGNFKGEKVALVPDTKVTLSASYHVIPSVSLKAKATYFGKSKKQDGNTATIDPYAVVDISAKYSLDNGLSAVIGIDNLFEKEYNIFQGYDQQLRTDNYIPAPKRTYYFGVRYDL